MKALIVSAAHFEDSELLFPLYRLQEAGLAVDVASISRGKIRGKHGYEVVVDKALAEGDPQADDLLGLPRGTAAPAPPAASSARDKDPLALACTKPRASPPPPNSSIRASSSSRIDMSTSK